MSENSKKHQTLMRTYNRSECVVFYRTREQYGQLSNMASGFPLIVNSIEIPSSEALYQACRFPHLPSVQRRIIEQGNAMIAKRATKPYLFQTRPDWLGVRVDIMRWCLRVKLAQHQETFGLALTQTGSLPIVEQSRTDAFWGALPDGNETLEGRNVLGRLLMELRLLVQENGLENLTRADPPTISEFFLLGEPILAANSVAHAVPQEAWRF